MLVFSLENIWLKKNGIEIKPIEFGMLLVKSVSLLRKYDPI